MINRINTKYVPSQFNIIAKDNDYIYLYNSLTNAIIEITEKEYASYKNFCETNTYFNCHPNFDMLLKGGFIVDSNENEYTKLKTERAQLKFGDRNDFNLTIAPNLNCNFNCIYCFEDGRRNGVMNSETINDTVTFLNKIVKKYDSLNITWYGGEPLLGIRIIETIYDKISINFRDGFHFSSNIVTNGYLLDDYILDTLKK